MDGFNLILMRLTTAIIVSASLWSSANAQSSPEITFNEGRLSVNANNVSVAQLADALSQETGIAIVIQGDTNAAMSADINDEPFEKAIAKLSPNHLLVHASKALDAEILEVVLIIPEGGSQASVGGEFLPSGAPAEEIAGAQPPPVTAAATPTDADPAAATDDGSNGQIRDKMRKLNARIVGANQPVVGPDQPNPSTAPDAQQQ